MTTSEKYIKEQEEWIKKYQIKPGDWVKVTKEAASRASGWGAYWVETMSKAVGQSFPVTEINPSPSFGVNIKVNGNLYAFPYFVLEPVAAPDFEIEMGKTYLDRGGEKVTIVSLPLIDMTSWDFCGDKDIHFTKKGGYYPNSEYEHKEDLIKEFIPNESYGMDTSIKDSKSIQTKEKEMCGCTNQPQVVVGGNPVPQASIATWPAPNRSLTTKCTAPGVCGVVQQDDFTTSEGGLYRFLRSYIEKNGVKKESFSLQLAISQTLTEIGLRQLAEEMLMLASELDGRKSTIIFPAEVKKQKRKASAKKKAVKKAVKKAKVVKPAVKK